MKSNINYSHLAVAKIIIITTIVFFNFNSAKAVGPLDLHFKAGLSTPNDKIGKVYSDENLEGANLTSGDFFTENASLGYHLGIGARIDLSDALQFVGGVEFHRFPRSEFRIKNPDTGERHKFKSTQNVFPVYAGINLVFINTELLDIYATGGFAYNYTSNSVDYVTEESDFSLPLDLSPDDSRVGYFIGAGTDLNLVLVTLNLELKYQHINLIGKEEGELNKQFLAISLGIVL